MSQREPSTSPLQGHPISIEVKPYEEVFAPPLRPCGLPEERPLLERIYTQALSGVVIKGVLSAEELAEPVAKLCEPSRELSRAWSEPNKGMKGGEILTLGCAATPTFSSFTGPTEADYLKSSAEHSALTSAVFGELNITSRLSDLFSELADGARASAPSFERHGEHVDSWAPFNYRALPPGEQIYTHHDQHYKLPIYQGMPARYDRHTALSWFITLQAPERGGELTLYGLWGTDPHPPMLPTRFINTEALEQGYLKERVPLEAGDLVIFDSGRYTHRVTPVEGARSRLTLGGFMTLSEARDAVAFWA